jgi:hypothetical protein
MFVGSKESRLHLKAELMDKEAHLSLHRSPDVQS